MQLTIFVLLLALISAAASGCGAKEAISKTNKAGTASPSKTSATDSAPVQTTPAASTPQKTPAIPVNYALTAEITASSSVENASWSVKFVNDSRKEFDEDERIIGFTSMNSLRVQHEEWLQFDFKERSTIKEVRIFPRMDAPNTGLGIPKAYRIEVSDDGEKWTEVATVDGIEYDYSKNPLISKFNEIEAGYVRVTAVELNPIATEADVLRWQVSEIEIY